jgi:hypothetical protein
MAPRRLDAAAALPRAAMEALPGGAGGLPGLAVVRVLGGAARGSGPFVVACALQVFAPRPWPLLRLAALLAHRGLRRAALRAAEGAAGGSGDAAAATAALMALPTALLEPFSGPALFFLLAPPLIGRLAPPLVRTAVFYRHMVPVVLGYMRTLLRDAPDALRRSGGDADAAQAVWDARHEWGAERIHAMLTELSGFYVKARARPAQPGSAAVWQRHACTEKRWALSCGL